MTDTLASTVLVVTDIDRLAIDELLHRFGLKLALDADAGQNAEITGSFWGESEAGIVGYTVYARGDTPVHSLLHEACHVVCMTSARRDCLNRDAGGDDLEEAAVCFLQIILADCLTGVGSERLMCDMDAWGYSFRLGSTEDWFRKDAGDAEKFLLHHALICASGKPTFRLRL